MFIVKGGAGFIGSNIIKSLIEHGITDILVIDDLTDGSKFINLVDLQITDYMDKDEFITQIVSGQDFGDIEGILHFGANTSLTESNGKIMMENNYEYSKDLLHYCVVMRYCLYLCIICSDIWGLSNNYRRSPIRKTMLIQSIKLTNMCVVFSKMQ